MEQNPASPSGGNIGELLAAREMDTAALDARTHSCHRRLHVQAPAHGDRDMRERDRMSRTRAISASGRDATADTPKCTPIAAVQYTHDTRRGTERKVGSAGRSQAWSQGRTRINIVNIPDFYEYIWTRTRAIQLYTYDSRLATVCIARPQRREHRRSACIKSAF